MMQIYCVPVKRGRRKIGSVTIESVYSPAMMVNQDALTYGIGAIRRARHAKSVFAHLYVRAEYICWVKRGKAMPKRLPIDQVVSVGCVTGCQSLRTR